MAEDIEVLRNAGYISADSSKVKSLYRFELISIDVCDIEHLRGEKLIRKAYEHYPYFAINSEIAKNLLDETALGQVNNVRKTFSRSERVLFTIGYEGKTIESYVNSLIKNNVHVLCDVRKNPISRKFGFSKNRLSHIVENVGIHYAHFPELGIESEKREKLETNGDYERLFLNYRDVLPTKREWLDEVFRLLMSEYRVALTCFERDPRMCHRHVIRDSLVERYKINCEDL
jgi:uncharacterized protein (DUF488 family)